MAAVQQNIAYKRELLAGDIVEIRSSLLELRDKSIRFLHEMRNAETGEIAATCEITGVHMDRQARKSAPFEEAIRNGWCMLEPKQEARLLQDAAPKAHEKVLEIGAGSGYMAALLASRAQRVISLEIKPELARLAQESVHQRRLSVIDVGDDGDVADVWAGRGHLRRRHVYSARGPGASPRKARPVEAAGNRSLRPRRPTP